MNYKIIEFMKIDRGLVYIGISGKKFTYGRYYSVSTENKFIIRDNCGCIKFYSYKDNWCRKNFIMMKKKDYILWARKVKLEKLYEKV